MFSESIDRSLQDVYIDLKEGKAPLSWTKFCIRSHGWAIWVWAVSWIDRRIVSAINRTISWTRTPKRVIDATTIRLDG